MVTVSELLGQLPAYMNREHVIAKDQIVGDIIHEVIEAHEFFQSDYDYIAVFFERPSIRETCKALFDFCKKNISYEIETEEDQTTRSPAATLSIGRGDCKHYAGFIAGVLDALKREGYRINWVYRFASYDLLNQTPGHVFVVVKDSANELWIDPVLAKFNERLQPAFIIDKKISGMLKRISGLEITEEPVDYEISNFLNNTAADSAAYNDVQTMLKYGMMNADMTLNDDLLPALQEKLPAAEFQKLQSARVSLERMAISGLGENIVHAFAKIQMLVPRNAYLSLVGLNVFGLANKLWHCLYTDEAGNTEYAAGKDKLYHAWYLLGGDFDKLTSTIRHGKKNKAILGSVQAVGVAPAIPAWVAAASVIIGALGAAISQILKAKQQTTGINYNVDPATGMPYGTPPVNGNTYGVSSGGIMSFIENNPLIVAAAAAGVYLLLSKKKAV